MIQIKTFLDYPDNIDGFVNEFIGKLPKGSEVMDIRISACAERYSGAERLFITVIYDSPHEE